MADRGDEQDEQTIAEESVVVKYKMAADIVNRTLKHLIGKCVVGETARNLCELGDKLLIDGTSSVFKKEKDMKKGVAFPTCVCVNNCICHFSPLKTDPDYELKDGDMVKIDLGACIDGFIAVVAHTIIIGASESNKVKGRKADVMHAAHQAAQAALRLVKPGNENTKVTEIIQRVAESYKCKPIEGMLSHQLKRFKIDGEKAIIQNPNDAQRKEHEKCHFDVFEVYAVDIIISTGEGKGREMETRTTVFKKTDQVYQLKLKTSRVFFSEMDKRFGTMPFTLRAFDDEKKARLGVQECINHKLLEPFHVLYEKEGECVAQFKFTLLLLPSGSVQITSAPFPENFYETEYKIEDEELKAILGASVEAKLEKKKKKKSDKTLQENNVPLNSSKSSNENREK